jgi:phage-related protein (TIGR01555 family)
MYELSWEARKIVRIPVEDALRKQWIAEGIEEEMAQGIETRLKQINFLHVLSRSLMLERLLGGCLTFMGLESREDDTLIPYKPSEGSRLRFCNAIPISRISRMTWDTNPLSESYMRPNRYLVNGVGLHTSRCLVWDGEPLFDPYDFALTNFRSNLAGFGPSKLAPIWDDIEKAVGTRQAAYQLIQTNNAIIAAITGLQDLAGVKGGAASVRKLKELVNSISVYRAALIDGERVNITQSAASFGSVPELIITFIQILSAASDIPATRFIGQAPGGLNATGQSDLENYYNVIDSFQVQRIEPALRRVYDIHGYEMYKDRWRAQRLKLTFKFPPLWNLTELQEGERAAKMIENVMKMRDANLMTDKHIIEELNQKEAFSIKLDQTDLNVVDDTDLGIGTPNGGPGPFGAPQPPKPGAGEEHADTSKTTPGDGGSKTAGNVAEQRGAGGPPNPQGPSNPSGSIQRLRNVHYIKNADATSLLIGAAGGDPERTDREQFMKGLAIEQEHYDTAHGDELILAKIVLDHLSEDLEYYIKLEQYVENMVIENMVIENFVEKRGDKWVVLSHDKSKTLGEYDSEGEANKRLRQIEYFKHENSSFTSHAEKVFADLYPQTDGVFKESWLSGYCGHAPTAPRDSIAGQWYEKGKEYKLTKSTMPIENELPLPTAENVTERQAKNLHVGDLVVTGSGGYTEIVDIVHQSDETGGFYLVKMADGNKKMLTSPTKTMIVSKLKNSIYLPHLHPGPTQPQRHAGNYKMHHLHLHGLDFSIENPWGSERSGVDKDGNSWSSILPAHYGYVRKTVGADGQHVDAYIGPFEDSELVFVVDQNDADTGAFDEHKCIFGALSVTQAKELYLKGFGDGRGVQRLGSITPMTVDGFKQWLKEGDTTKPYANSQKYRVAFDIDGKVYEGRAGEIHAQLLARLPENVQDKYYGDSGRQGFMSGFVDERGDFQTRGDIEMRTGKVPNIEFLNSEKAMVRTK